MNLKVIRSSGLTGDLEIPSDKSISHRAVMISAISAGEVNLKNFLFSEDCLRTVECFRSLKIEIERIGEKGLRVKGKGLRGLQVPSDILYVGNSGTTIRLLSGILAGQAFISMLTGDESIQKRPMQRIIIPLTQMGAKIAARDDNFAPLIIEGSELRSIEYELPVPSAQVKSAILFAGLFAEGITRVTEKIPARDHTERMLEYFGADIKNNHPRISISAKNKLSAEEIDIPADISSAAFFLVGAAIVPGSKLMLKNIGVNPTRTGIIEVLHRMGADLKVENERIISNEPRADILVKFSRLKGIDISGEIIPKIIDEIPVVAVAATQAVGRTVISGARELRVKESDRIATTVSELRKLGADITELEDGLAINGPTRLKGAVCKSFGDHRIAMAAAIAGLVAEGETWIENTECIETSFPDFKISLVKFLSVC